jgi:transposase
MATIIAAIGIDLGDRFHEVCLLGADGSVRMVRATAAALEGLLKPLPPAALAMEAGAQSPWASRVARACGHLVVVANPRAVRAIWSARRKSDRRDAELLARLVRLDAQLLRGVHHRSERSQEVVALVSARDALVRCRTALINHVRGVCKGWGAALPCVSARAFARRAAAAIPGQLRVALMPVVMQIGQLTVRILDYDRMVEALCEGNAAARLVRGVPGVGALTALSFVAVVDDPRRFADSRTVAAWLGLVPGRRQSGQVERHCRISRAGNGLVRRLLVNCAHYVLGPFGPDSALRRWGLGLAERGGSAGKRRAVVAVSRKLAVLLHRLWVSGRQYEAFPAAA